MHPLPSLPVLDCFCNESNARDFLELQRWPPHGEAHCPHCKQPAPAFRLRAAESSRVRAGLWKCRVCRKQFTVTVGTLFETTHVPLHKWLMAAFLTFCRKGGCQAPELAVWLAISRKAAYKMANRFAYARREHPVLERPQRELKRVAALLLALPPEHKHPLALERRAKWLQNRQSGCVKDTDRSQLSI